VVLEGVEDTLHLAGYYSKVFSENPTSLISQVAMTLDQDYSLALGESLKQIRTLLALRVFLFDIRKPWSVLTVGELEVSSDFNTLGDRYASSQ